MSLISIALTFFLITNPIGNTPAIVALIKNFSFERQKKIVLREAFFVLLISLFFQYFGQLFLSALHVERYTVTTAGGVLILLVALELIFPHHYEEVKAAKDEPFLVPIATPLLAGPGLFTTIMLKSGQVQNAFLITGAILISWLGVTMILLIAPYLQRTLGKNGVIVLEQVMGMLLAMMGVDMLISGLKLFVTATQ